MKLKLDLSDLQDDFFEDTSLLGITAPIKNYQFCLQLNKHLGFKFSLNAELEIQLKKKQRDYFFSVYQSPVESSLLNHYLYQNQFDGEYLLPEFKHMDFLWLIKGDFVDPALITWIIQTVRSLPAVQMVTELTHEQIKNKGNMIF